MKKMIFHIFLIIFSPSFGQSIERELVSSSGNSFSDNNYQIDFSLGEVTTETFSNQYYIISQGFHQNYSGLTDIEELKSDENLKIYPNPTNSLVNIEFERSNNSDNFFIIELSDIHGKVIERSDLNKKSIYQYYINHPQGIYFLKIFEQNKILGNFKIIKLK